jgi:hypothetical protein
MRHYGWALSTALVFALTATAQQFQPGRPPVGGGMPPVRGQTYLEGGKLIVEPGRPPAVPNSMPPGPAQMPATTGQAVVGMEAPAEPMSEAGLRFGWEQEPADSPFRAGTIAAVGYLSASFGIAGETARIYGAHAGVGYYYQDNLSFNVEVIAHQGGRVEADSDVPGASKYEGTYYGAAFQLLARYHYLNYGTWSLFTDAGLGFSYLSTSVPRGGTNYNFILTAGLGLTKQLDECTQLFVGHRWFHLSNGAFFTDNNPGYDSKMFFLGILKTY